MEPRPPTVHLITAFEDAAGGSEWRALNLYDLLAPRCDVRLWSQREIDHRLPARYPIRRIAPRRLAFPKSGTFVFIGVFFPVGRWIALARPSRVVLMYNTAEPAKLEQRLRQFDRASWPRTEMIYTSAMMRAQAGLPGPVEISLFPTGRFVPAARRQPGRFTIGRLSRPELYKHHPDDAAFYRRLAADGCRVSIMGAPSSMQRQIDGEPAITLLPSCALEPQSFLQGLDCFFFRTDPRWLEPWARVISEAMACGLPIVAERRGGYAEIIDHGRNGFLFDTEEDAHAILMMLKDDPRLRGQVGAAARETQLNLMSEARRADVAAFYVAGTR